MTRVEPTGVVDRRYIVLAMLTLTYMVNFVDRQLLAVLAQPIKAELHLSDTQLGLLTGLTFALFYTVFGIPIAALADRGNRARLVAAACAMWSAFTIATSFATGFVTLALARVGVGIGEAGGSPPSYSILSDYFTPQERGRALAIYSMGVPLGTLLGIAGGAHVASVYGWRMAFLLIGAGGLVLAPLILLLVHEPERGRLDTATQSSSGNAEVGDSSFGAALAYFVRSPVLLFTALAGSVGSASSYGFINWAPTYLQRVQGMSLAEVSAYYSVVSGVMMGVGIWIGGYLVDRLAATKPAYCALIPAGGMVIVVPFLFALNAATGWRSVLAWMLVPLFMSMFNLAPILSITQNLTPARFRATCSAILLFMLNLIGLGVGPLFVGLISDRLEPALGPSALGHALTWLTPIMLLSALLYSITAWHMHRGYARH